MVDLHRHSEFSLFDGFGNAKDLAAIAKEKGHTSLGMSEHGTVSGWIKHYQACKEAGIKPIFGIECYYQPEFTEDRNDYHLCLFAKNLKGYQNINRIITKASKKNFYYRARVTDDLLRRYSEGIICTTACIAGYVSQAIKNDDLEDAEDFLVKAQDIFSDDFYIEIQPYKLTEEGLQEKVNEQLMRFASKLGIDCILTSDSHFGRKEDFETVKKMHKIAKHDKIDIEATYKERYMPTENELVRRFVKMHSSFFKTEVGAKKCARRMIHQLEDIEAKVEDNILDQIVYKKLQFGVDDPEALLKKKIISGMKKRGITSDEYKQRVSKEFEVIKENDFADYFLVVQDYIKWAKDNDIKVGPGRGSVCNSVIAYALGITDVDSVKHGLIFERFLRKGKKKYPDVDIDFETKRRDEAISYVINKYKGKAAQVCSYGLYKVDNALNDLFKVCDVESKEEQAKIKAYVKSHIDEAERFCYDDIKNSDKCKKFNAEYDNIIEHFSKLYHKIRYIGTHAAGVAIAGSNIVNFCAIEKRGGLYSCAYDLEDLETLGILKFDFLGLKTMSEIKELEKYTGKVLTPDDIYEDSELFEHFREGDTDGIFQFESATVRKIFDAIECDCFEDVCAANAMNRPGPLSLGTPQKYAENKQNIDEAKKSIFYKQTKETYGTVVYQEQIMRICREIAGMTADQADKMMKLVKDQDSRNRLISGSGEVERDLHDSFINGCESAHIARQDAESMFSDMATYSFNAGHAYGYSIIACYLMWYKLNYPEYFWLVKLKYADKENFKRYERFAVKQGSIILTPHVNGTAEFSVSHRFGDACLQEGLCNIPGVGAKVAVAIEKEKNEYGDFESYVDFKMRMPKRIANVKVFNALEKYGALEFNKNKYLENVKSYNTKMFGKG